MDKILHQKGNHGKPFFVGIYRGIILPGSLRWCKMGCVHPQYPRKNGIGGGGDPGDVGKGWCLSLAIPSLFAGEHGRGASHEGPDGCTHNSPMIMNNFGSIVSQNPA